MKERNILTVRQDGHRSVSGKVAAVCLSVCLYLSGRQCNVLALLAFTADPPHYGSASFAVEGEKPGGAFHIFH